MFIDADKANYMNYYEEGIRLIKSGGIIAVDNTLWSGRVLNPHDKDSKAIDELNKKIRNDSRVDAVMLTVRDGLSIMRKRINLRNKKIGIIAQTTQSRQNFQKLVSTILKKYNHVYSQQISFLFRSRNSIYLF